MDDPLAPPDPKNPPTGPGQGPSLALDASPVLDHREAKARVLCMLGSGDPLIASKQALDALTARNKELLDGGRDAIRSALADQAAILENLSAAYTLAAIRERRTDHRRALQGVALRATNTLVQVLGALHRVTEDQRDAKALPA
ncbi:MAG: hypothetical protein KF710_04805 [Rhodocyclaceae bacterium]|nr:hypothetical protein [Rhodocyclaceae bacterium]